MDPTTLAAVTQATPLLDLVGGVAGKAAGDAPVLLLMWFMLREIKAWMPKVDEKLRSLETTQHAHALSAASDSTPHEIRFLKERMESMSTAVDGRLACIEREQRALWHRVGNRPEDKTAS